MMGLIYKFLSLLKTVMWYWIRGFLIIVVTHTYIVYTFRLFLCVCSVWLHRLLDAIYLLFLQNFFPWICAVLGYCTTFIGSLLPTFRDDLLLYFVLYIGVWPLESTSCTIVSSSSSSLVTVMFWAISIHLRVSASSCWIAACCHCPRHCHCFNIFPFYLKYLTNAEYTISSWPVASKSTLMITSNFLCIWS